MSKRNSAGTFTRAYILDVCSRYAQGEDIADIAFGSGNSIADIEGILRDHQKEMQEAFNRSAPETNYADRSNSDSQALTRIAEALERLCRIIEKWEESSHGTEENQ